MIKLSGSSLFARAFSSAILMQAVLSGANLLVSLMLIRGTSNLEYGYYVLFSSTMLLLVSLQAAYINPSLVNFITDPANDLAKRQDFMGGLFRSHRRALYNIGKISIVVVALLWVFNVFTWHVLLLIAVGTIATQVGLLRDLYRMVLFSYRRHSDVLRGDIVYAVLLVIGAALAVRVPIAAAATVLSLTIATYIGGHLQRRSLQNYEPWQADSNTNVLRMIFQVGAWATAGSAIHWVFSQGYNYLVASSLSVASVAAIAATRTLVMPVNLISTGISTFMYPTVAAWLQKHDPLAVLKRQALVAIGMMVAVSIYLAFIWFLRDWIFAKVLGKRFNDQDLLLGLWIAVSIVMLLRDQLIYILVARARFKLLSAVTLISAIVSLTTSYFSMQKLGEGGALIGLFVGEVLSVIGLIILSWREVTLPVSR